MNVPRTVLTSLIAAAAAGAVAVTALAGSAKIAPPANVAKAGKIVWCSDIEYPPFERRRKIQLDVELEASDL